MTTVVIIDTTIISSVCYSAVSGDAGGNFDFRVGVFHQLFSWSRVILGAVAIYLDLKKVIMCWCNSRHDLFSNSGDVNKDGYSGGYGDNDGNGRGGRVVFL